MDTKNYTMEIVLELLKSPCHAGELARKFNLSRAGALKILSNLSKKNTVDYKIEGRNKIYSLKKTLEARSIIFISEHYKLLNIISQYPVLRGIFEKIQNDDKIRMALLFGSYAKSLAGKDSDIDIYIDSEDSSIKKSVERLNSKISAKIGNYNEDSLLIREINKNHVIIKGAEQYYGKRKFLG
jgi:predicted nucleotidyltransferase/predicted transcriptional regulator